MRLTRRSTSQAFERVRAVGLTLPGVEAATRYDGSPVLKWGGAFMAGMAMDESAEPGTLVVRMQQEERDLLIADAPDTYYVTDYYAPHPIVLVRLAHVDESALRDLLSVSLQLTRKKGRARVRATSDEIPHTQRRPKGPGSRGRRGPRS